jgi:aldehyde:ferredoxin oxidoreductase
MSEPYIGRVLRVDLSSGKITEEQVDSQILHDFVGGNGVGVRMLYSEVPPSVKPLDPENRLIFASGPLAGTRVPGSGTFSVVTKGPLTGFLTSAQASGYFGARMRFAGFDFIIFQGAAPEWQYLYINDGKAELRSARHLLGLDTWETEKVLKEEVGQKKASVACIGPAGENLVSYAAVCCDEGHVAATNGPGAVMGSKKLKAVVVYGSKNEVELANPEKLAALARGEYLKAAEIGSMGPMIKSMGTSGAFEMMFQMGGVPTKNYSVGEPPADIESRYGQNLRARYPRLPRPCWSCSWAHCSIMTITDGELVDYKGEEPEFEGMSAWTTNIGNDDFSWAVKLGNLNDGMGLCLKECSYTVAMAIELFEKGVLTTKDTDGLELNWGKPAAVAQLIENIAHRRGFGEVLASGVKKAAERIGGEALNVANYMGHGLAPQVIDGRGYWPYWFDMEFSDSGSFYGNPVTDPDLGVTEDIGMFEHEKFGYSFARNSWRQMTYDTLGGCYFLMSGPLQPIVDTLNAATGWNLSKEEFVKAGRRITVMNRAFNLRHGMVATDDLNHSPRYGMAQVGGPMNGVTPVGVKEQVAKDYYREHGWDEATSKPLPETLKMLGLDDVAKDFWS